MVDSEIQVVVIPAHAFLSTVVNPGVMPYLDAVRALLRGKGVVHAAHERVVSVHARVVKANQAAVVNVEVAQLMRALRSHDAHLPKAPQRRVLHYIVVPERRVNALDMNAAPRCSRRFNCSILP